MEVVKIDEIARNEIVVDIETTGLLPWFGDRVTCICARDSNGDTFSYAGDDEHKIVSKFFNWIIKMKKSCLITFNGKHFDIPFIMTRFTMLNRFCLFDEKSIMLNWQHIDLHQELKKLTGKRISLDTVAKLMGCDSKSGKGKDAIELWRQGRFDELKAYCMQDVEVTWQVYHKYKKLEGATGQDTSTDEL
jgi:3'-5' exonuclease